MYWMTIVDSKIKGSKMKSIIEREYEKYLDANDTIKIINGVKFYKAIWIGRFKLTGIGPVTEIVLPYYMFKESHGNNMIENEKGEFFQLRGPAFLSFRGKIPEWYLKCGNFYIDESEYDYDFTNIGEFFASC